MSIVHCILSEKQKILMSIGVQNARKMLESRMSARCDFCKKYFVIFADKYIYLHLTLSYDQINMKNIIWQAIL